MNHYITPDNKTWGFDNTQMDLVPLNAVLIPLTYALDTYSYLTLVDGVINFDQTQYDADIATINAAKDSVTTQKNSALAKLTALGLTENEIKALIGQ